MNDYLHASYRDPGIVSEKSALAILRSIILGTFRGTEENMKTMASKDVRSHINPASRPRLPLHNDGCALGSSFSGAR